MSEHEFTLILDGPHIMDLPDSDWGKLHAAGCDDATFGMSGGVWSAIFHREGPTLADVIASAIRDVERAGVGLRAIRVEAGDPHVSTREVADRLGVTREAVRLWSTGKVGPGGFPAPVSNAGGRAPAYRWSEVAAWLAAWRGDNAAAGQAEAAGVIEYANARLRVRELARRVGEARKAVDRAVRLAAGGR